MGVWRFLEIPRIDLRWRDQARRGAYAAALLIVLACLWRAAVWQNMTRAMMELPPVDSAHPLIIAIVAVGTFALLWCILMLFRVVLHRARLLLDQFVPPRVSLLVGFILVVWFFWALGQGVVLRFGFQIIDSSFSAADQLIEPETERPNDPTQTGSTASLVQWEVLGRWGRDYINRTPTASDIAEFAGPTAMQPVRVYVGLRAAETVQQRANLALRELIRAGGFERSTLVVMVPVGTGWMDPGGQDTLEFILGGDVATVAVQYSYLKGAFSVLANSEIGFAQSKALFDTIYQYWSKLPKNARPRFFVHGLSQGAQISQTTVPILDFLNDPIDGALWVGSPFFSPIWRRVRDARHSDSPAWLPRYGNGSLVRAANQKSGLEQYDAPWGPMRLVFLNYASDPIVLFSFASAYRRPDWLAQPRAFDVSPHLRWFPFVTMLQVALDTSLALDIPGYGHYYHARDYIDAWVAVLEPPNWTAEHSARLKLTFKQRAPAF
ncbi:MAG: alpha/beta hydrolase [Hyphomicrobiaceae bacterium]